MKTRPTIVVLAAGRGTRYRGPSHKLRERLGSGSVLEATLRHAVASHLPVVVVTTDALAAEAAGVVAARDVVLVPEADGAYGMGHSIAAGVSARGDAPGWLLLPGDMPLVQPATLLAVADALDLHAVAYAQHQGRRGHPVGFAAELYSELIRLSGDEGARRIVARYPAVGVEVNDAGVLLDIDTEDDLAALRALDLHGSEPLGARRSGAGGRS